MVHLRARRPGKDVLEMQEECGRRGSEEKSRGFQKHPGSAFSWMVLWLELRRPGQRGNMSRQNRGLEGTPIHSFPVDVAIMSRKVCVTDAEPLVGGRDFVMSECWKVIHTSLAFTDESGESVLGMCHGR